MKKKIFILLSIVLFIILIFTIFLLNQAGFTRNHLLTWSILGGYTKTAKLLIFTGADINSGFTLFREDTKRSNTVTQFNRSEKELWIKGLTPLTAALISNNTEIAKILIKKGVGINRPNPWKGISVLDQAFSMNNKHDISHKMNSKPNPKALEIVKLLIKNGADVNFKSHLSCGSLHNVSNWDLSISSYLEIIKLLIETGVDVNIQCYKNSTPLHSSLAYNNLELSKLLIKNGANINMQMKDGSTALHLTSITGNLNVAKLLIQKGASINILNKKSETPLFLAVKNKHSKVAQLLIEKGAQTSPRKDKINFHRNLESKKPKSNSSF